MTPEHPMNLPEKLKGELWELYWKESINDVRKAWENSVAKAYRAGADDELKACVKWFKDQGYHPVVHGDLRAARRPKPPSLAEQGQRILVENGSTLDGRVELDPEDVVTINAALKRLQELEKDNE